MEGVVGGHQLADRGWAVQFHDVLHGFWVSWGAGTASLKANLLQQLMAMMGEFLYEVLLDLRKSYYALGR